MLITERPREAHVSTLHSQVNMSDARPYPLDLPGATTRRFPKVAVRHRSPVLVNEGSQSSEESNAEAISRHDVAGRPVAGPSRQSSSPSSRTDGRHQRQQSKAIDVMEQQHGRQAAKKKNAGLLGFLTLKEPSTYALEEFAEQERRKAAQKNLKSDGVTLPGVSSRRLPDHVPKVNSKWDGLPDSAKRKLDKEREKEKAKRSSVTSFASHGSGDAPRRSYGSLSSKSVARQSRDKSGAVSREGQVPTDVQPDTVSGRGSSNRSNDTCPALRHTQGHLTKVRAQTVLHPPTPPVASTLDFQDNAFDFDLPDLPNLQEREYSSGSATSPESSPPTPALDAVLDHDARPRSPAVLISTSPRYKSHLWPTEPEGTAVPFPGPNSSKTPMALSKKDSGRSLTAHVGTVMPPIQEARPSNASVRNFSRPAGLFPQASATPTRKVNSAAVVKAGEKNEVLPWEMFEPPPEASSPAKATPESSILKRFSKLGRR